VSMKSEREKLLDESKGLTCGDRDNQYGEPKENMAIIAEYWTTYFKARGGSATITGEDVANCFALTKLSRTAKMYKRDNYADMAAYVGIACECAEGEQDA